MCIYIYIYICINYVVYVVICLSKYAYWIFMCEMIHASRICNLVV